MYSKHINGAYFVVLLLACVCLTTFLGSGAARAQDLFPVQGDNSVAIALTLPDGQQATCQMATVLSIHGRNNPPFLTICDSADPNSRVVVLARAPLALRAGVTVTVSGVMGTLPGSSERCITGCTIAGYPDPDTGNLTSVPPAFGFLPPDYGQVLDQPAGPIADSDPSFPDDGMGIAGPVSANLSDEVTPFNSVADLLAAAPPVLTPITLACLPVTSAGDGFVLVGDDSDSATVKVYVNSQVLPGSRVISLQGRAHSEAGNLAVYAGNGPSPFFDVQDSFPGNAFAASPGTTGYAGALNDSANSSSTQSLAFKSGEVRAMGVESSTGSDGNWVYLTGQVVTAAAKLLFLRRGQLDGRLITFRD